VELNYPEVECVGVECVGVEKVESGIVWSGIKELSYPEWRCPRIINYISCSLISVPFSFG
jgi:hypothetical protein